MPAGITQEQRERIDRLVAIRVAAQKGKDKIHPPATTGRLIACPNCDSTMIRFRNSTGCYRCYYCHAVFEQPVERPSRARMVKVPVAKEPETPITTKACPNCDSPSIVFRKRTKDYRCDYCHGIFEKPVERPARRRGVRNHN